MGRLLLTLETIRICWKLEVVGLLRENKVKWEVRKIGTGTTQLLAAAQVRKKIHKKNILKPWKNADKVQSTNHYQTIQEIIIYQHFNI